ncbi:MAG: MBL fold metallo-hydrolase [Atopobiaceae bacterium]|nr:MBL fold metallo-hydrolase [Atopobiaceae bacterium]
MAEGWVSIDHRTWRYEDDGVRFFLLTGSARALLIDSGMHVHTARELATELTNLPLSLFNTHCDRDHTGSNDEFDEVWVSLSELVHPSAPRDSRIVRPVWDGDIIDLGNRRLEAIALPGHTPGSMALLDLDSGMLFSGDPIQRDGRIYMFGAMRSLAAYIHSLRRLQKREAEITSIWPSHATCPVDTQVIGELIAGAEAIERGEVPYEPDVVHGIPIRAYDAGPSILLCDDVEASA